MSRITTLHVAAKLHLLELLTARHMPYGWNREAARTVEKRMIEVQSLLDAVLSATPDRIIIRPDAPQLAELARTAASQRRLQDMLKLWVESLSRLEAEDQESAAHAGLASKRVISSGRLLAKLSAWQAELGAVDFNEFDGPALEALKTALGRAIEALEDVQRTSAHISDRVLDKLS